MEDLIKEIELKIKSLHEEDGSGHLWWNEFLVWAQKHSNQKEERRGDESLKQPSDNRIKPKQMEKIKELEEFLGEQIEKLERLLDKPKGKVNESVFSGESCIIPMADVQHIERHWYGSDEKTKENYKGVKIITKHTKWDMDADTWANNIYLSREEADKFLECWCMYRHELEFDTLAVN